MLEKLRVDIKPASSLNLNILKPETQSISLDTPVSGTRDYNRLRNKPVINDVPLEGNISLSDLKIVSENTVEGWNNNNTYIPKSGELIIYTDYIVKEDESGKKIKCPAIKIGDGEAYVADLPILAAGGIGDIEETLYNHINDSLVHITDDDRNFWNNKLNYEIVDGELIFTRN